MEQTADLAIDWHLVGHLQSNKAKRVAGFAAIHAIDSLELLLRVDRAAAEQGASPRVLIQVDLAGETTKFGIAESDVAGLIGTELHAARLVGLMLLPPYAENPEDVRPWFRRLRELAERLRGMGFPPDRLAELSMGMSHDFRSGHPGGRHDGARRDCDFRGTAGSRRNGEESMKVTPLDLRQQKFKSVMRGFDRDEVVSFLSEVADDYEQALREADRLKDELTRSQASLEELRDHERNLRNTLLTAQKLADEIRNNAEQEAGRLVREAEGRAELVLQKAQSRLEEVQREVETIRVKRKDAEASLESTIASLRNSLEFIRQQDVKEREDNKIVLHRPRIVETPLTPTLAAPTLRSIDTGDIAQAR